MGRFFVSWLPRTMATDRRQMTIESKFVRDLGRALNLRHISEGISLLNKSENALVNLLPTHPHATEVLLLVAQWIDVGYQNHHLLDELLHRFPPECRRKLALEDFLRVRMAEGFRALSDGGS